MPQESEPERLPTLRKVDMVRSRIKERYFGGQHSEMGRTDAVDYANALLEDSIFNPHYYDKEEKRALEEIGGDPDYNEDEIELWQNALGGVEKGNYRPLKDALINYAVGFLQDGEPEMEELGASLVNLAFSIKEK